jgi:hypothetical protein
MGALQQGAPVCVSIPFAARKAFRFGAGELVDPLVFGMAIMPFDPVPVDLVLG